ncbi:tetratricopeptide repeat protein, partial [Succinimonas sp.]|uniref:tetratricopeptide repeat protein n=1 Tax=Succinimonas sp. TaxID=1936151 RepID=UPI0038679274
AKTFYEKGCKLKEGDACNNLGLLYARGNGVRHNPTTAKSYFKKACDLGSQNGCNNYRLALQKGF